MEGLLADRVQQLLCLRRALEIIGEHLERRIIQPRRGTDRRPVEQLAPGGFVFDRGGESQLF